MDFIQRPIDINTYFDKIFYINLDKDVDKNTSILSLFKKQNITNFQRVSGHIYKKPTFEKDYRNFIKDDTKYILGSLGCRDAHLEAIRLAKQNKYQRILILEDDIDILQDLNELITNNELILNDWDMLYFGGMVEPFFRNQIVGAYAYGVNSIVYDDILEMAVPSGMEIDNFYAKIIQKMSYNNNQIGKYRIRTIQPFNQIVVNYNFKSNIR
jgi:GR25 family glycosyltransferase involved in LPS biosynthesis